MGLTDIRREEVRVASGYQRRLGTKCDGLSMDALIFDGGLVRGEVTPEHIETVLGRSRAACRAAIPRNTS